jgi:hypothetical protein
MVRRVAGLIEHSLRKHRRLHQHNMGHPPKAGWFDQAIHLHSVAQRVQYMTLIHLQRNHPMTNQSRCRETLLRQRNPACCGPLREGRFQELLQYRRHHHEEGFHRYRCTLEIALDGYMYTPKPNRLIAAISWSEGAASSPQLDPRLQL